MAKKWAPQPKAMGPIHPLDYFLPMDYRVFEHVRTKGKLVVTFQTNSQAKSQKYRLVKFRESLQKHDRDSAIAKASAYYRFEVSGPVLTITNIFWAPPEDR